MGFLDNYEDVASRIVRFWETHPSGRIDTNIIDFNAEKGYIFVQCQVFRKYEDEKPSATDYAFGNVATYNVQMKRFFCEDTITSAIGRAIGLLLGVDKRPTRQDMEKVETIDVKVVASTSDDYDPWANSLAVKASIDNIAAQLGGELIPQAPQCEHGHMKWREGDKNGKAWGGFFCTTPSQTGGRPVCPTLWYVLSPSGQWEPQKPRG